MEITINYSAVFACGVLAMALGALWYGPLFGRKWMEILGVNPKDIEKCKEMQKESAPLYAVQFGLVLLQLYVLAHYIAGWEDASGIENALWIWLAFVMPTIAGSSMWTNDSTKVKWERFLIQSGYQLVCFVAFGFILSVWR
ncbi:MAG TPA: DUF1761 domain-containing protein [Candidatus Paceibacterota bacterium]|nr:DUF1761 domain-containing protein [Candidatus Paceibacterota bacterium]